MDDGDAFGQNILRFHLPRRGADNRNSIVLHPSTNYIRGSYTIGPFSQLVVHFPGWCFLVTLLGLGRPVCQMSDVDHGCCAY